MIGVRCNRIIVGVYFLLMLLVITLVNSMSDSPETIVKETIQDILLGNQSTVDIMVDDLEKIVEFRNYLRLNNLNSIDILVRRDNQERYLARIEAFKYHPNGDIANIFYGYLSMNLLRKNGEWVITNIEILKPLGEAE